MGANCEKCSKLERGDSKEAFSSTTSKAPSPSPLPLANDETLDFLARVPLFKRLPKDTFPDIAAGAQRLSFQPGEKIISQGDKGDEFFIIMHGVADVYVDGQKVASLKNEDYFGEVALLRDEPRNATIVAASDLLAVKITRSQFKDLGLLDKLSFPPRRAAVANTKVEVKPPAAKNPGDRQQMLQAFRANNNLQSMVVLGDQQLEELIDIAWIETIPLGTNIITQGDTNADYFYIVKEGSFEIFVKSKDGKGMSLKEAEAEQLSVGIVASGGSFGELALLYSAARAATVKAQVDSQVWVIDRNNFKAALARAGDVSTKKYLEYIEKVKLLDPLKDEEKAAMAKALNEMEFSKGEIVFQQGDAGDAFYILVEGEVDVIKDGAIVATLTSSPENAVYFGELALLHNQPRLASIQIKTDNAKTLKMDRTSFDMLLGPLEELQKRGKDGSQEVTKVSLPKSDKTKNGRSGTIFRKDLKFMGVLGCGAFGYVELVQHQETKNTYAMKSISKGYLVKTGMQKSIINEKEVLLICDSNFIIKLHETYNDGQSLLLLLEIALGGELWCVYERKAFHGKEAHAQFYVAGVVFAFEHLHERKVMYRDLKPENLLLNDKGHIKLTDMGFAKVSVGKTYSTCGTPDYFAPEVIESKGHSHAVDWWALGILTFELMSGKTPFESATPMQTCQKIKGGLKKVQLPPQIKGRACESLIKGLLEQEPSKRLPMKKGGAANIKANPWYKGFNWDSMFALTLKPPYIPQVQSGTDINNFQASPEDRPPQIPYQDDGTGWDKDFATST